MPNIDPLVAEVRLQTGTLKTQLDEVGNLLKGFKAQIDETFKSVGSAGGGGGGAFDSVGKSAKEASGSVGGLIERLQVMVDVTGEGIASGNNFAKTMAEVRAQLNGLKAGDAADEAIALTRAFEDNTVALKKNTEAEQQAARDTKLIEKLKLTQQALEQAATQGKTTAEAMDQVKVALSGFGAAETSAGQIRELNNAVQQSIAGLKEFDAAQAQIARENKLVDKLQLTKQSLEQSAKAGLNTAEAMRELQIALSGVGAGGASVKVQELTKAIEQQQAALRKNTEAEQQEARDKALIEKLTLTRQAFETAAVQGKKYAAALSDVKVATAGIGAASPENARIIREQTQAIETASAAVRENGKGAASFFDKISSSLGRIAVFTLASSVLVRSFFAIQTALSDIVKTGIEFNSTLEQAKFGIAALLTNSRELASATGEIASNAEAYPLFLEKAKRFQREIQLLDAQTLGTGQELQEVFERVLAFSQNQVATDRERLQLSANILNASKLLGLQGEQVATETRQILTLERDQGQQILQTLGLRAKELRAYRDQGTLVQKLNDLLKVYSIIAGDVGVSFEGLVTTAQTFFSILKGQAFEDTFGGLKDILKGAGEELKKLTDNGGIVSGLNLTKQQLQDLGKNLADVAAKTTKFLADLTNGFLEFAQKGQNAFKVVAFAVSPLLGAIEGVVTVLEKAAIAAGNLATAFSGIKVPDTVNNFLNSNFGRVSSSFVKGLAVGSLSGNPLVAAGVGAANALNTSLQIEEEEKAIKSFTEDAKPRLEGIAKLVAQIPQEIAAHPDLFQNYLQATKFLQEEIATLKKNFANLPDAVKPEAFAQIKELEDSVDKLTNSFERMKGGIKAVFSAETLKTIDDFNKRLVDARQELQLQQRITAAVKGGIASGASDNEIEQAKARITAEQKILADTDKLNEARQAQLAKFTSTQDLKNIFEGNAAAVQQSTIISPENLEALKQGKVELVQIVPPLQDLKKEMGDLAVENTVETQTQADATEAKKEHAKAAEQLKETLANLGAEIESANAAFLKTLSSFNQDEGAVIAARFDAAAAEISKKKAELVKKFGDDSKIPSEAINKLTELDNAKRRQALADSIKDTESFSNKRVSIAEQESKRVADARNAEIDAQKILNQQEVDNLTLQQKQAEENTGIAGRINNTLADRIRLIKQISDAEIALANADLQKEQVRLEQLRSNNDTLTAEIARLQVQRADILQSLQQVDTLGTSEQEVARQEATGRELDRILKEKADQAKIIQGEIQEATNNIGSFGDKATRVATQAADEINKLSTTVVHLNDPIANLIANLADGLEKGSAKFKDIFKTFQTDIYSAFNNAFRDIIKSKLTFDFDIKNNIGGLGDFIKNTFSGAFGFVSDLFGGFGISLAGPGSFLSNLIGSGGGGGLTSLLGASGGTGPLAGTGQASFLSDIFGGQLSPTSALSTASPLSSLFGGSSAIGGSFAGTNVFGGTGPVVAFPPGTSLSSVFGNNSAIGGNFVGTGSGGIGAGIGAGLLGNSVANIVKSLFGFGGSSQSQTGGSIGGLVGGAGGFLLGGPIGSAIGSFLGNILGSLVGSLFAPGRIATEKKDIQKFIGKALPDLPNSVVKEPVAAAGLANLSEDNPALIALGIKFASTAKKATQGTVVRFAGQLAADLSKAGDTAETAQDKIETLAKALSLDLGSGISAINGLMDKNVLSFKTFQKEVDDSRKNLSKYADTSNLTVKELNDLAVANGNTGSRIVTVGEALAGVIDISSGFSDFINGTAIANNYLADSFDKVAHEGDVFNDQLKEVESEIRSGKLTLEEGVVALNKFRKEAGLAAVDLSKFKIDAGAIQKQVDAITTAVDTIRTAFKTAISSGLSGATQGDIQKAFKTSVEQALVDAVVNGMVDGFIKAAEASGPISAALASIGDLVTKFVSGDISQEDFFKGVHDQLAASVPLIQKLAEAAGFTADQFRQILNDIPEFKDLLTQTADTKTFTDAIASAGKGAISTGIEQGLNSAEVGKSFKSDFYTAFVSTVEDAMVAGIVNAALATGPLKAALEGIGSSIADFATGKISIQEFITAVKGTLDDIGPVIDAIAEATGIAKENIEAILKEKNITINVKASTGALADAIVSAGKEALSAGITGSLSSSEIAQAFKGNFYNAFADTVEQAMIDGIVNAALATGPLKAALDSIGKEISDVASGKEGIEQFTASVGATLDKIKPVIDAIAEAVGITSAKLKGLLEAKGITLDLKTSGFNFTDSLRDATASAITDGIVQGSTAAEVATAIRRGIYKSILDSVVQAFVQGIVSASLSAGPLKAATEGFSKAFADFSSNKTNEAEFAAELRKVFADATPFIKRFSDSLGVSSTIISDFFKELGVLPDVLGDTASAAADLAHTLRQAAKDLLLDESLSPLKPKERVTQAETSFEQLRAQALAGDKDAAAKLPEAGQKLLTEARKVFASSTNYEKIFDFVRQSLLDVADSIDPVVAVGDEQLRTLQDIRQELKTFGDRLFGILDSQQRFQGILLGSEISTKTPTTNTTTPPATTTTTTGKTGTSSGGTTGSGKDNTGTQSYLGGTGTKTNVGDLSQYYNLPSQNTLPDNTNIPNPYGGSSQNTTAYTKTSTTTGTGTSNGQTDINDLYKVYGLPSQNTLNTTNSSNPYGGSSQNTTGQSYGNDVLSNSNAGTGQPYGNDVLTVTDPASAREMRASTQALNDIKASNATIAKNTSQTATNTTPATGTSSGAADTATGYPTKENNWNGYGSLVANNAAALAGTGGKLPTGFYAEGHPNLSGTPWTPPKDNNGWYASNYIQVDNPALHNAALGNRLWTPPTPPPNPPGWTKGPPDLSPGYQLPTAWGPITYLGSGAWSKAPNIPQNVQDLAARPNATLGSDGNYHRPMGTSAVSLAEGGIVTAKEIPALLHGPEAVIPLNSGQAITVTDPGVEREIRANSADLNDISNSNSKIASNTSVNNSQSAVGGPPRGVYDYDSASKSYVYRATPDLGKVPRGSIDPPAFGFSTSALGNTSQAKWIGDPKYGYTNLVDQNAAALAGLGPALPSGFAAEGAIDAVPDYSSPEAAAQAANARNAANLRWNGQSYGTSGTSGGVSAKVPGNLIPSDPIGSTTGTSAPVPKELFPSTAGTGVGAKVPTDLYAATGGAGTSTAQNIITSSETPPEIIHANGHTFKVTTNERIYSSTPCPACPTTGTAPPPTTGTNPPPPTTGTAPPPITSGGPLNPNGTIPGTSSGKTTPYGLTLDDLNPGSAFSVHTKVIQSGGQAVIVPFSSVPGQGFGVSPQNTNTTPPPGWQKGPPDISPGYRFPTAWGDIVYLGGGKWSKAPFIPENIKALAARPDATLDASGNYVRPPMTGTASEDNPYDKSRAVSLAEGGIVKGWGVPAVLHGPEAVIPLPTGNGRIEVSVPDLLGEIQMLREEIRSRSGDNEQTIHVAIDGAVNIGSEKMGAFVVEKVQKALDKQQMRVPQKVVKG